MIPLSRVCLIQKKVSLVSEAYKKTDWNILIMIPSIVLISAIMIIMIIMPLLPLWRTPYRLFYTCHTLGAGAAAGVKNTVFSPKKGHFGR